MVGGEGFDRNPIPGNLWTWREEVRYRRGGMPIKGRQIWLTSRRLEYVVREITGYMRHRIEIPDVLADEFESLCETVGTSPEAALAAEHARV